MLTRVGNLLLASLALLLSLVTGHPPLSFSLRHHFPLTVRGALTDAIVIIWFAGALGLFSRRRWAWIGSLLGTGAWACLFGVSLISTVWLYVYPNADMQQLRDTSGPGYIFELVLRVGVLSVFLAIASGLFFGLLRMRKELR